MIRSIGLALVVALIVTGGAAFYLAGNIYLRDGHVTVPDDQLDRPIPAASLRADLAVLLEVFEETHVDFAAINGDAYSNAVQALRDEISAPMTRLEFYRALAPLNALLTDGHTSVMRPAEELDRYERNGGRYLPILVEVGSGSVEAARPYDDNSPFHAGDAVLSINNVPAEELAAIALSHLSGENLTLREAYAARSFYRTLALTGVSGPFTVEIERNGQRIIQTVEGVTRPDYVARRAQAATAGNELAILNPTTAVLTFSDMPSRLGPFSDFLETSFDTIAVNEIQTLIIDIRANSGGDSRAGNLLLSYVADRDYPALERVDVKVTERIQDYYETLLPSGFRWLPLNRFVPILRQIASREPGTVFSIQPDGEMPLAWENQRTNAFTGELIVLTGPATYSSAAIFAAPLSHYDQAVFIGEETGEPTVFFGENYVFDLPNSRLQAVVSHKRFDLVGEGNHQTGIQPDIAVAASSALETAMLYAQGNRH